LKDGIVADTIRCSLFLWTLSQDNFSAHPTSCLYFPRKKIIEPVGCEKINIFDGFKNPREEIYDFNVAHM